MKKTLLTLSGIILISYAVGTVSLTMEEAKKMVLTKNPAYLAKQYSYKSSQYDSYTGLTAFLPTAKLNAKYMELDPGPSPSNQNPNASPFTRSYDVTINQPIFYGGKLLGSYLIKKDAQSIAKLNVQSQKLTALADVESKYFTLLEAKEFNKIAQSDLTSSTLHMTIAKMKYENGVISKPEYLKMQSQNATKDVSLLQANTLYSISEKDLANYLQIKDSLQVTDINFENYLPYVDQLKTLNSSKTSEILNNLTIFAKEHNNTIKITGKSRDLYSKAAMVAGANFLPMVNLTYTQAYTDNSTLNNFEKSSTLLLTASVPIFPLADNGFTYFKAKSEYKRTVQDYNASKDAIELAVESSFLNLLSNARQIGASRLALEYTQETYNQLEERYKNGMLSVNDMMDGEVMLLSAQTNMIKSKYAFLRAKSTLALILNLEDETILWNLLK